MDKIDIQIVNLLTDNARIPVKQIADAVGLSSPSVKTRIEKMQKEGIIRGFRTDLDPRFSGFLVTAFISVAVESELRDEFRMFVSRTPNVLECHGITGSYFALLKVLFRSNMELDNFLSELQHFGETNTNIVLSTYKDSSYSLKEPMY